MGKWLVGECGLLAPAARLRAEADAGAEPRARAGALWAAAVALLIGCRTSTMRGEPAPRIVLIGPEDFVVAEQGRIDAGPLVSGSLEPRSRAVLASQASGSIEYLRVEIGDPVKAGELLVRVQARDLQGAVTSARTALSAAEQAHELARRQRERTRQLIQSGALAENDAEVADNELAMAEANRDQARAALATARERVSGVILRAPFDGVISERNANLGDVVTPGAPLLTIIDPSSMRLDASVPSDALSLLAIGQAVEFTIRGLPGQTFRGSIERIGPAADAATRQIPLLISLPNPSGRLVAGLFAEGHVAVREEQGLIVPSAALESAQGNTSVRRLQGDRVEVVDIELGVQDASGERVQVVSGLAPGDRVLTGAAKGLPEGTAVELRVPAG